MLEGPIASLYLSWVLGSIAIVVGLDIVGEISEQIGVIFIKGSVAKFPSSQIVMGVQRTSLPILTSHYINKITDAVSFYYSAALPLLS
jgi:hypothetical protein